MTRPWRAGPDGLDLTVRLTPKGGRDALDGVELLADGRPVLKARVRAAASDGAANAALIGLLARTLRVPQRDVSLTAGAGGRIKRLRVVGPGTMLAQALEKICPIG
jgi:uncharacterized protein YggU (UPF0235/DUF167 family)